MIIDLLHCPPVIRASVAATLSARRYCIVDEHGADVTRDAIRELGNNVAQALTSLDTSED